LSSLAAREVFVGTMGTLMALGGENDASEGLVKALREAKGADGLPRYTLATAVSLLLFFAVALQCVSTIAVVRRETGSWRWPALQFASFFLLAYALAFAGYRLASFLL
jgi:ferrous iron transport protein B